MIGIVGCGSMGGSMAARLAECGHEVVCYDASAEARARVAAAGVRVAEDLNALAALATTIILSLPKADIVRAVMAELAPSIARGTVVLDTSTSEPETTRALAAQAQTAGHTFIDGPVSGGPGGARAGTMTMVLGGEAAIIEGLRPMLADMTAKVVHVGPAGSGHAAKIANNLLCAANLVLVAEMGRLAKSAGVPLDSLLEGVNAGSGRSGVSEVNFPRWILSGTYDSGFTTGLMRKDVGLAVSLAERAGLDLPATRAIAGIWEASRETLPDSTDFNEITKYGAATDV